MTAFAIGDIQGCYTPFRHLLDHIGFDPEQDELWLTGDLVNRGDDSLKVLRFLKKISTSCRIVLGNHDLHLIGMFAGVRSAGRGDTLNEVLNAPDAEELIDWLRQKPLLYHDRDRDLVLVHAGVPPQWDLITAKHYAEKLSDILSSDDYQQALPHLFGRRINLWTQQLSPWEQMRFTAGCLTGIRFCTQAGELDFKQKGSPQNNADLIPWYDYPSPAWHGARFGIGHWAALGIHHTARVIALDSGCVWGNRLTATNLDFEFEMQSVDCHC
ncbi:MAG: symmetrical bis(5'-nucleosyl)-tetraphosphatase [Pseudomonadota bacterium]